MSEAGINTFLKALFTARAHYLNYGSVFFVPATTANQTNIGTIPFPGVPGGIDWAVFLSVPVLGLFPDSSGGTSPLPPPAPNTFSLHTTAQIKLGCSEGNASTGLKPLATTLDVWALGEIVIGSGSSLSLKIDKVLLPGIQPVSLEKLLECLLLMVIAAALQNLQLPIGSFSLGAFDLNIEQGPEINDDQIKLWGSIT
jgi:hypothetical protein